MPNYYCVESGFNGANWGGVGCHDAVYTAVGDRVIFPHVDSCVAVIAICEGFRILCAHFVATFENELLGAPETRQRAITRRPVNKTVIHLRAFRSQSELDWEPLLIDLAHAWGFHGGIRINEYSANTDHGIDIDLTVDGTDNPPIAVYSHLQHGGAGNGQVFGNGFGGLLNNPTVKIVNVV